MLLFTKPFHAGLVDGSITLTFRLWDKPRVKPGGRYRCHPIGVLEVDALARVTLSDVTDDDARRAGFSDAAALVDTLSAIAGRRLAPSDTVWRVALHHGGDGDRVAAALDDELDEAAIAAITAKLDAMDARADAKWTRATLARIEETPHVAASKLAAHFGRETASFKADVVKLKKLGLTQSFEVGYDLTPRGRAYVEAMRRQKPAKRRARPAS